MDNTAPVVFEELRGRHGARIGVANLNAEKSLNALTLEMIDLLGERLRAWADDTGVVLVILQGAGERAFCAGADLHRMHRSLLEHHASPQREDITANRYALDFFTREYRLDYLIHTYPKPVLAWGHGVVMGGGMGLLVGASHRVFTEQARVAMPEINIGLYADVGGSWFLARAPGQTGLFLALTAAQLGAADALFAGLGDFHIMQAHKPRIMAQLLEQDWHAERAADGALLTDLLRPHAGPPDASGPLRRHFDVINALCAHDEPARIVAGISDLHSDDPWLARAAQTLRYGSPSTAALSIALQRRLKLCSLAQVLRAELVASLACGARPDLAEGIRALLIDKDRKPRWQPAEFSAITSAWVDGYFASPWQEADHPLADL